MRKLALSFTLLLLCQAASLPACRADDSAPDTPADTQRPAKQKKVKAPKADAGDRGKAAVVDPNPNMSVDQTLDEFLGKPGSSGGSKPPSNADSIPPPVAAPPMAPAGVIPPAPDVSSGSPDVGSSSGADVLSTSGPGPDMSPGSDTGSAPDSSASMSSSSGDDHDDVTINEQKIPEKTIRAGELNNQAVTALDNKEFQKAIDLLKQAIAIDPSYTQGKSNLRVAYFNYGVELYNEQKYSEAIPCLEKALALSKQLGRNDAEIQSLYDDCKQAVKEQAGK